MERGAGGLTGRFPAALENGGARCPNLQLRRIAVAQYCISPDGLLPSCDRLARSLLAPADPLGRFLRVAEVVRYLIDWSKPCESHIDETGDAPYRRYK